MLREGWTVSPCGRCERQCSNGEEATVGQHEEKHGGGEQPLGEVKLEGREVERHDSGELPGGKVFILQASIPHPSQQMDAYGGRAEVVKLVAHTHTPCRVGTGLRLVIEAQGQLAHRQ